MTTRGDLKEAKSAVDPLAIDPNALAARLLPGTIESLTAFNDHVIRLSVKTEPYRWHQHPDADETFICIEGELVVELDDQLVRLQPGMLVTVPAGTRHRTRPGGARSVNLSLEKVACQVIFED